MRRLRLAIAAVFALIAATVLVGCTASVAVYDYTENGVRYTEYEIALDGEAVTALESTAGSDADGNKYTVEQYLYRLFTDYGYSLVRAKRADGGYTVVFRKATEGEPELFAYGTSPKFVATSKANPFIRTYTAVSPSPFNGLRAAYESIPAERSATMLERIKNGLIARNEYGDKTEVFPSIETAFPYTAGANKDGLLLKYRRVGSERTASSGTATPIGNRNVMYEFARYFDTVDTDITLEYKRPVPYGWYLVAIAAGGGIFAAVFAVLRRKNGGRSAGADDAESPQTVEASASIENVTGVDDHENSAVAEEKSKGETPEQQGDEDNAQTERP